MDGARACSPYTLSQGPPASRLANQFTAEQKSAVCTMQARLLAIATRENTAEHVCQTDRSSHRPITHKTAWIVGSLTVERAYCIKDVAAMNI